MIKLVVRVILVLAVLALGVYAFLWLAAQRHPPAERNKGESSLAVEAIPAAYAEFLIRVEGYGTVRSARRVMISPEITGEAVYVRPTLESGEIVEKDELLFRIDPRNYQLALKAAKAETAAIEANVEVVKQQQASDGTRLDILERSRDLARSRFERLSTLFREEQVGTLSEVEAAESAFTGQENQVALLKSALALYPRQLAQLAAGLETARVREEAAALDVTKCEVRAPFRGRLSDVRIEEGQLLGTGIPVMTLIDDANLEVPVTLDSLEVRRWLFSEGDGGDGWYSKVRGAEAVLRWTEAPDTFSWPGRIVRVERISPETRALTAVIAPERNTPSPALAEGMFCTVEIPARKPVRCVRVPRTAVTHEMRVYLSSNNRLKSVAVEVVYEDPDFAYIEGPIEEGDLIIVTKLVNPIEGRLVKASPPGGEIAP